MLMAGRSILWRMANASIMILCMRSSPAGLPWPVCNTGGCRSVPEPVFASWFRNIPARLLLAHAYKNVSVWPCSVVKRDCQPAKAYWSVMRFSRMAIRNLSPIGTNWDCYRCLSRRLDRTPEMKRFAARYMRGGVKHTISKHTVADRRVMLRFVGQPKALPKSNRSVLSRLVLHQSSSGAAYLVFRFAKYPLSHGSALWKQQQLSVFWVRLQTSLQINCICGIFGWCSTAMSIAWHKMQ